jgi:predicted dehydrogenase
MTLPGDRSGGIITLNINGQETINDERLLDLVPDFRLEAVTADLFGGDRLWNYTFTQGDAKNIAIEYGEFAEAIAGNRTVEVDAYQGTRSVAVSYAILESGATGQIVQMNQMLDESINTYQREIDEGLGI